ncbi:hypothetical protein TNCT_515751 [Trichonephila clavata]|uniref:Uncharacterized protein n=1 Tax=Trichonephila clavata TaxID=2740835 RepID=A0A8X6G5D6_TRICU|nr:hypothetical protein TNCT_515751 [Trichonephila clavata]
MRSGCVTKEMSNQCPSRNRLEDDISPIAVGSIYTKFFPESKENIFEDGSLNSKTLTDVEDLMFFSLLITYGLGDLVSAYMHQHFREAKLKLVILKIDCDFGHSKTKPKNKPPRIQICRHLKT